MPAPDAPAFLDLVRRRRAVRHFAPDPVPAEAIARIAESARWAPSGYNLQPIHLVVVEDAAQRAALRPACMGQAQVVEAPVVFVVVGDTRVARHHLDAVLAADLAAGAIDAAYAANLRRVVGLVFGRGPLGLGAAWKALLPPLLRRFVPVPALPAVDMRFWLAKQGGLAAMAVLLAATAEGLASLPMEGFDDRRVRRVLGLPRWVLPILVIPVGHAAGQMPTKTRLPAEALLHRERW